MDLSRLSSEDLQAISAGDLSKVSSVGLKMIAGEPVPEVDSSVMDANDARAKSKPQTTWQALQQERRASPVTRFLETGPGDAVLGVGQLLSHLISPVSNKPAQAMDSTIKSREEQYRQDMVSQGKNPAEPDWPRMVGAGLTQAGMMPAKTVGATLGRAPMTQPLLTGGQTMAGRAAQGAAIGGATGATQLVTEGDYAQKAAQNAAVGMAIGGAFTPVAELGLQALSKGYGAAKPLIDSFRSPPQLGPSASVSGTATATGKGGGYNFGYVGGDPSAGLTRAQKDALDIGKKLGFKVTPGQETGSRAAQQLEAKLSSQPMTSGPFNSVIENNQKVLNRVAAKSIGEASDTLDSSVLGQALERIGKVYEGVATDAPKSINQTDFINKLAAIETEYDGLLPTPLANNELAKRLFTFAENGQASGRQLQDLSSRLGKVANREMTTPMGNRELGSALFDLREFVDDMLSSGLSKEAAKEFAQARSQYRTLIQLTARTNIVNPSTGNVSGVALSNLLQTKDRKGFLFGKNGSDLYSAARFAQAFKPLVGDSGTATRSTLPSPTDFVLSLPFNLATRAYMAGGAPVVGAGQTVSNVNRSGVVSSPLFADLTRLSPMSGLLAEVPTQRK
jgi:hypothetical protein